MENESPGHHRTGSGRTRGGMLARLRNYFLTGVIFAAPLTITIYLTWTFINWVDNLIKPLIPARYNPDLFLPFPVPGIGLVIALTTLTLLGFLTANIFGRTLLAVGEGLLDRMPLIRNLYKALKQIFETALSERASTFRKAGLIEYPRRGLWAVVFVATEARGEIHHKLAADEEMLSVFLPTTPNPTSGFLLFVPRSEVTILDMSVEDAAKLIISAGLITPEYQVRAKKLAIAAGRASAGPEPEAAGAGGR